MLRIVLPVVASSSATGLLRGTITVTHVLPIRVVDEIVVVVDVDVVIASAPSAVIAPPSAPSCSHRQANPKRDCHSCGVIAGRRIVDWWVGISWRTVHYHWVIAWNVDDLRIGLLHDDHLFVFHYPCFDLHLLVRLQVPLFLRLRAHALDGIHDVTLLRQECVAEFICPLDVVHQTFDDIRKRGHGLDAWVPRLLLYGISKCLVF